MKRMEIPHDTVRTLKNLGWAVGKTIATKFDRGYLLKVWGDGRWLARASAHKVGTLRVAAKQTTGKENHPALAACEANEVAWQNKLGMVY